MHVTLRTVRAVQCLRAPRVFPVVRRAIAAACREGFRIIQFSVQSNHVHLLVEAKDGHLLSKGIRGLVVSIARAVNRVLGRRGALWGDRYHARALTTPRAMRHALAYVLMNFRKHLGGKDGIDPCSSAGWFEGWKQQIGGLWTWGPSPIARARTWLATTGWRRLGLIGFDERPARGS